MKVLEKGRPQTGWAKECICTGNGNGGGCGAKLLVEQDDLYGTVSCCRDETTNFITFECPECSVETDIDVPSNIRYLVGDRRKTPHCYGE